LNGALAILQPAMIGSLQQSQMGFGQPDSLRIKKQLPVRLGGRAVVEVSSCETTSST
jgi:hypothetical protein